MGINLRKQRQMKRNNSPIRSIDSQGKVSECSTFFSAARVSFLAGLQSKLTMQAGLKHTTPL